MGTQVQGATGLRRTWSWTLAMGAMVACLLGCAASARAATDTVTSAADSGPGSLRAVIAAASSGDTVGFAPGLDDQTIDLASAIAIGKSLTIAGPGAALLRIDAGHSSQIFTISAGNLSISGLTLANGAAPGGGQGDVGKGGAIEDEGSGSLSVSGVTFDANTAGEAGGSTDYGDQGRGGAIYAAGGPLAVSGSTFTANTAGGAGGSGEASGAADGGAIAYRGTSTLTVSGSTFVANTTGGHGASGPDSGLGAGGAIEDFSGVSLSVSASTFAANAAGGAGGEGFNSAVGFGGAIFSRPPLTVSDSTFAANTAGGPGGDGGESGSAWAGAIEARAALTVSGSTFTANTAGGPGGVGFGSGTGFGGAIRAENPSVSIADSTLVGNAAGGSGAEGYGGAIFLSGHPSTTLASVTIDANVVGQNGEGAAISGGFGAILPVTAKATIISGNTGATNCDAHVASSSYSLEGPSAGETSCGFDLPSANPELEPLANNGGPTETQGLPESSPAVDAVPAASCPTSVDQRGEPRPDYGKAFCDAGAFELQGPLVAPAITSGAATTFQVGKADSFTVIATGVPKPSLSEVGALPGGVDFTAQGNGTARLSGTPAVGSGGIYPITIKASNGVSPDATQSFTLTVQAPPTVSITTPVDGATYAQGQVVDASFSCSEGAQGPGLAACVDQDGHPSGTSLDTATLGKHSFAVTATSKDGLTARASVTYEVAAPTAPRGPASPKVAIRTGRALVVHGSARIRLACGGGASGSACSGVLSLTRGGRATDALSRRRGADAKTILLGRAPYTVASGQMRPVTLRLTTAGLRLLSSAHHRRLVVQATAAGKSSAQRAIVLQLAPPPRR